MKSMMSKVISIMFFLLIMIEDNDYEDDDKYDNKYDDYDEWNDNKDDEDVNDFCLDSGGDGLLTALNARNARQR